MTVNKTVAIAFLVALGFSKAPQWEDKKLKERLAQVPQKVTEEDVPEGYESLYKALAAKPADEGVDLVEGEAKTKPAKTEKPKAPKTEEEEAPKKGKPSPKPAKSAKPAKTEKPAKVKPARAVVEKDQYGCRKGTISAKVNEILSDEWQSEQEVADAAGVSLDQARGRLYYAAEKGLLEHERLIRYRLARKPAKGKSAKE